MRRQNQASEYTLTELQIEKLIYSTDWPGKRARSPEMVFRDRTLLKVLCYCALRASEAAGLDWKDIDLRQGRMTAYGKGDKKRDLLFGIPYPDLASDLSALKGRQTRGPVFVGKHGRQITRQGVLYVVQRAAEYAGIESPHPGHARPWVHLLRHSWVRNARRRRPPVPWEHIQQWLGHDKVATTMDTYGTPDTADTADAIARSIRGGLDGA